jgi:hypothetical protein
MMETAMMQRGRTLNAVLVTGTLASLTSTVALCLAARAEGRGALQPLNATSHWLNGETAASFIQADVAHTAVGYATHHAASIFWAILFERWDRASRSRNVSEIAQRAAAVSALAAAVDYVATPKRFTPGWELVLTKRSMAGAYAAMALGLAMGALRRLRTVTLNIGECGRA